MTAQFSANVSFGTLQLCSKENGKVLETLPIVSACEDHRGYILSTWVRSYEAAARKLRGPGGLKLTGYRQGEAALAERHWGKSLVVVSSPEDTYTAHAWVCGEQGRLYHVYVPPSLRGCGVARGLVEMACGKTYSVHKPWTNQPRAHQVDWNPYT